MGLKNFSSNVAVRAQVAPALLAAGATSGTGIDVRSGSGNTVGFEAAKAVIYIGATSGSPDSFTFDAKVEDSADNSQWATATDADGNNYAITQQTTASQVQVIDNIDLNKLRRYVRITVTPAFVNGTSPKIGASAVLLLGNAQQNPVV